MITSARIHEDFCADSGISWITALRAAPSIQKLAAEGALQLSLFDTVDLAEIAHPGYPGGTAGSLLQPGLVRGTCARTRGSAAGHRKGTGKDRRCHQTGAAALTRQAQHWPSCGPCAGRFHMGRHTRSTSKKMAFAISARPRRIAREKQLDGHLRAPFQCSSRIHAGSRMWCVATNNSAEWKERSVV